MAKIEKENKDTDGMELAKYISVKKSVAAGGLYAWCQATLKAYDINKDVEPKKLKAKQMKAAKEKGERELAETEASLAQINKTLGQLNANKKIKQEELDELTKISNEMTRKLNAASQLINGLGSE